MKKIIIYTTEDKIISLHLVKQIVSNSFFKNYKIDIVLSKPNLLRKIKILITVISFGSVKEFFLRIKDKVSIKQILKENKNCRVIKVSENENYEYGLSVYATSKIKLQNFKIYNFHLGSLYDQRGSFIFFYKFIKSWDEVSLTFHEISERFDVGQIVNERKIKFSDSCFATDIFFVYLNNMDFLMESIKKIDKNKRKKFKEFLKLNVVPSFFNLFKEIAIFYLKKLKT